MFPKENGLSKEEVKTLRELYGYNVLPEKQPPSQVMLFISQLKSPLIYILLFASVLTMVTGHMGDAYIILFAVFLNTVLGYIQERRVTNALRGLKKYITRSSSVIRNGERVLIDTTHIVPGDVVILDQGTKIPADGMLLFANRLFVDESLLTGESIPVIKIQKNEVYMGTIISSGQALMRVATIGADTKIGAIAKNIQTSDEDSPLQRQIKIFSKQLIVVIAVLIALVFLLGFFYQISLNELFLTSVALAVSSIPEGLLVSLTVVLALGMQKIIQHKGLVKKLSSAETLGGVTVICLDKTGTLTEGKMEVVDYVGNIEDLSKQVLLANDLDDPMLIASYGWGKEKNTVDISGYQRLDSIPFSPKERMFISLYTWTSSTNMIFVNGAPELLLTNANLSTKEKEKILTTIESLTKEGKRLIGFARKEVDDSKKSIDVSDIRGGLTWVGILALSDPVRVGVKEALAKAQTAGIRLITITGDYQNTSTYVLSQLGLNVDSHETMLGEELTYCSSAELAEKVKSIRLFARTTPDQKLSIVNALKKNGEIVAMMGDGVNDAPALHTADIGIVVENATDVAKESADLVLLDSNFSTIVSAIEEGRAMFDNIRKIILYLMSDAFVEIIVVVGSILFRLPLPVSAVQILWINLVSDGFPDLSLTIDPKRKDLMKETPRNPNERLVNSWMMTIIAIVSFVAGVIALTSFIVLYITTGDLVLARSFTFIVLGLNSFAYIFSIRSLLVPFWKTNIFENKWMIVSVIAGFCMQLIPFINPTLLQFFGLTYLSLPYWLTAITLSVAMFLVIELFKVVYGKIVIQHNGTVGNIQ